MVHIKKKKSKIMEQLYQANTNQKKAEVGILSLDKVDFRT